MISINHILRCYGNLVAMATRVKTQLLICLKSHLVRIWYGGCLGQWASTTYLVAMVTQLPWQPE